MAKPCASIFMARRCRSLRFSTLGFNSPTLSTLPAFPLFAIGANGALTQTQLSIPVTGGRLQLGTWQGIFLLEHRASPHRRALVLTLIGEEE